MCVSRGIFFVFQRCLYLYCKINSAKLRTVKADRKLLNVEIYLHEKDARCINQNLSHMKSNSTGKTFKPLQQLLHLFVIIYINNLKRHNVHNPTGIKVSLCSRFCINFRPNCCKIQRFKSQIQSQVEMQTARFNQTQAIRAISEDDSHTSLKYHPTHLRQIETQIDHSYLPSSAEPQYRKKKKEMAQTPLPNKHAVSVESQIKAVLSTNLGVEWELKWLKTNKHAECESPDRKSEPGVKEICGQMPARRLTVGLFGWAQE